MGKRRAYPVSLAFGESHLVRLSLFGFGLSELGYHKLKVDEKVVLENLFAELSVVYPSIEVFQKAIELRQQRNVS
ncbi:MAG TPA: hypothetical protein VIH30_10990, partial [Aquirhabdus sp.]